MREGNHPRHFSTKQIALLSLAGALAMTPTLAAANPACEALFVDISAAQMPELKKTAAAELASRLQAAADIRAEQTLRMIMPSIRSGTQSPMLGANYIIQTSNIRISPITKFIRETEVPSSDAKLSLAAAFAKESNRMGNALEQLSEITGKAKSLFGRLIQSLIRPRKKIKHLTSEIDDANAKLSALVKEVEVENKTLGELFPQVQGTFEFMTEEIQYLNAVAEKLSQEAWALSPSDPLRVAIESEMVPLLMQSTLSLRSTQLIASGLSESVDQRMKTNTLLLQEAHALQNGALPAFLKTAGARIKKLLENEDTASSKTKYIEFCVGFNLCTGQTVYGKSSIEGELLGIYPDGKISLKTSLGGIYTFKAEETASSDPSIEHLGMRPGQEGVTAQGTAGKIVGIFPTGHFMLKTSLGGLYYVEQQSMGRTHGSYRHLTVGKAGVSKGGVSGTIVAVLPMLDKVIIKTSLGGYYTLKADDVGQAQ